jgi:magnesium-transporting ATPase (P-type)
MLEKSQVIVRVYLESRSILGAMSFINFVIKQAKLSTIFPIFLLGSLMFFFLPKEYGKDMPSGFESLYFLLILFFFVVTGFILALIEYKRFNQTGISYFFDQAIIGAITLLVLLIPIYLIRPRLFGFALLGLSMEFGLIFGKYIYIRRINRP